MNLKILKLMFNNNYAMIETYETDKDNPKPYKVRKIIKLKKDPEVIINGEVVQ